MAANDFLQVYDLEITTKAPFFIGDGKTVLKKAYLYDHNTGKVSIFKEKDFFALIVQKGLIDRYEQFMLSGQNGKDSLNDFFRENHLREQDWMPAVRYQLNVASALDAHHSLKDIHTFLRDAAGQAYVPGSSVKGALRTVLLQQMILAEGKAHRELVCLKEGKEEIPEKRYLHTLRMDEKTPGNAVNSMMRGIRVSDSLPVEDKNMILAVKSDVGTDGTVKKINVCRESIRPETRLQFKLTLDQSLLKGTITREVLCKAIDAFGEYYQAVYSSHFKTPPRAAKVSYKSCLFLGGGSGFFSKSLLYPYLGEEEGLRKTAKIMRKKFEKHHAQDERLGISPHTMKYTEYGKELYPMGLCEVKLP